MDKWTVFVGCLAMLAACSCHPRRSNQGVSYALKQSRLRNGMARRPAIRSKLSLPALNPSSRVRHHLSVKNLPVPDGHLNIIKQTVVLKSPRKVNSKTKQMPKTIRISLPPNQQSTMPAYNPGKPSRGRGGASKGRRGHAGHAGSRGNNQNNAPAVHPSLLPALNSLNKNLGGLLDAIRGSGGSHNAAHHQSHHGSNAQNAAHQPSHHASNLHNAPHQSHHGSNVHAAPHQSFHHATPTAAPLPIIGVDNTGHFSNPNHQGTLGGGLGGSGDHFSNPLLHDQYLGHAGGLLGHQGPLSGMSGLGFSAPSQRGASFGGRAGGVHQSGVGISLPSHGSANIGLSAPGTSSARLGLSVPGHGQISVGVSGPAKGAKGAKNSKKSSRKNTKNELIIMPNGPNTKAIRISTNGKFNFAKVSGQNNKSGLIMRSHSVPSRPTPPPSGEDPPEVGELGEQP